ncbi:hypothetical protein [Alicyclobacillus sp. SO9]|uniref:family 43 glycosylhydrolase n=1 Tax=Alicyclobacillus sp. SO9 TaxID=2665646 RepID=UPI0018E73A91|nr:hypothetical protein [Alicyclobacillus sp. SO9]QQE77964.1 hypothetical protein GI364_18930 [Alicyclobacillus sp. SO9]
MSLDTPALEKYLTPHKYGKPVLSPSGQESEFDSNAVDIPFVFFHNNRFYMMYVGFDGKGYQTALAVSDDLIKWEHLGVILHRKKQGRWDDVGAAGTWILREDDLSRLPTLKKFKGKYWLVYHSYPQNGYENGPAEIGLAWSEDENLLEWNRLDAPVYSWRDGDEWESGGLYKACLIEDEGQFYMFYNAKNTNSGRWIEQTGVAMSADLINWHRSSENPILRVTPDHWDSQFVSDPCVVRDGSQFVMYYFGYNLRHAQDGIAFSRDLIHWDKHTEPIIPHGKPEEIDGIHAHKAAVVRYKGVLYHFYCASRNYRDGDPACNFGTEFRCISLATSHPL